MERLEDDGEASVFSCEGDTSLYNMVYVTYDGISTEKFAFNKCVSGWNNSNDGLMPYAYGERVNYTYKFKAVTLKCNGYDKTVHIWTPDGYNKKSAEKYATIYALERLYGDGVGHFGITEANCALDYSNEKCDIRSFSASNKKSMQSYIGSLPMLLFQNLKNTD